ncbi:Protogenin A [Labeo rohita]|uniref:Protogenin A n=1 Tax=Labeo rohita TaxID=84645 RepID=A0ABQ8LTP2_LABRO|nr:Protogenin A [Labeo rohita]
MALGGFMAVSLRRSELERGTDVKASLKRHLKEITEIREGLATFTQQPASITVTQGSVARFSCKIMATPPPIITWEFNRVTLPLATERITVLPSGVLQIQGVEQADAGSYRCVATNIASRRRSSEAVLTVTAASSPRVPQRPRIIAGPQNLTVAVHSTALLECMATGNPRPLISWSRADHKSIDVHKTKVLGNGNLLISDVKPQHAGIYFCRATTPGTRNYTIAAANITVIAPPSLVEWPESVTRPRAGTARFVCVAEGFPTPQITWLKNGEPVHSNGRVKMYNSKLVINQIIPEDDGIYQCQAENDQGSVLAMARLIVVMSDNRPSAPRNVRADTVSSSAILLAWERPMYNSEKVIAYSVHYMKAEGLNNEEYQIVIGNDTTRYIIDDLEAGRNYTFYIVAYMPMVPLRAPELSLTSRSPSDIQVSWQPLSHKLSRGRVSAYRLSYRTSTDGAMTQLELSGHKTHHLLEGLQPDTTYLLRIAAATSVGWGEPSAWTSHRTPKASSTKVPLAPELQLESQNCTTVVLRWHLPAGSGTGLQGYKLSYHEESEPEGAPIQIPPHHRQHTIGGLGDAGQCWSSHEPLEEGVARLLCARPLVPLKVTLICACGSAVPIGAELYSLEVRTRHRESYGLSVQCRSKKEVPCQTLGLQFYGNSSSSVFLHWARPAFTGGQTVNYTIRCNPVGLQNASLVLYLHTVAQSLMVTDLDPNTNYEFAVRLHVDQLSSPWSPVVYQTTLPEAPTQAPVGVKVTLIEGDTALVSWKAPDELNVAVTRYTILYASRRAWAAGEWKILQREGSITMALLENLQSGQVYLVKVSASNQMGDGPFSPAVELTVRSDGHTPRTHGSAHGTVFSDGFYHLDQRSMTGIVVGVKSSTTKTIRQAGGQTPPTAVRLTNHSQAESVEGGTNLIINSYGPVRPTDEKKKRKRWNFFKRDNMKLFLSPLFTVRLIPIIMAPPSCATQKPHLSSRRPLCRACLGHRGGDSEGSHSSEGSHETGDSGRYSHDDPEATNLSLGADSRPSSLQGEESEASDETPVHEVTEKELHLHAIPMTEMTPHKQEMIEPHPV